MKPELNDKHPHWHQPPLKHALSLTNTVSAVYKSSHLTLLSTPCCCWKVSQTPCRCMLSQVIVFNLSRVPKLLINFLTSLASPPCSWSTLTAPPNSPFPHAPAMPPPNFAALPEPVVQHSLLPTYCSPSGLLSSPQTGYS